jgi:undecaprenyl-diphosphatase
MYETMKSGSTIVQQLGMSNLLIGFAIACVSAVLAVKWMVGYLNKSGLAVFGYYRLVLGVVVAILLMAGWVTH